MHLTCPPVLQEACVKLDVYCAVKRTRNILLASLSCTASTEERSRPADYLIQGISSVFGDQRYRDSYCEHNGTGKANGRADNLTMARVLIGAFVKSQLSIAIQSCGCVIPHWKQTKGIGKKSHILKIGIASRRGGIWRKWLFEA